MVSFTGCACAAPVASAASEARTSALKVIAFLLGDSMSKSGLVQQGKEGDADGAVEHESRLAPVPFLRLPAGEPLAADHHEAAEPQGEAQPEPGERDALRGMEFGRARAKAAGENRRAGEAQERGDSFDRNDQPEGNAMPERGNDG